jgi:hypothetical protein
VIQGIDHLVIAMRHLAAGFADNATLRFTVTTGGEHTGSATHHGPDARGAHPGRLEDDRSSLSRGHCHMEFAYRRCLGGGQRGVAATSAGSIRANPFVWDFLFGEDFR